MTSKKIIKRTIKNKNGIAKVSDMVANGASRQSIKKLYADGYIERVRQGYYRLSDSTELSDEQIISLVIPNAVFCMERALFYYGYSDFMPRVKSIAVPRSDSRRIAYASPIPIKVYYVAQDIFHLGKMLVTENHITYHIYDRERTICDIFKHRNKIDNEIFNKAVNAYAKDENKNLGNLPVYAKKLRVYKNVIELMEVLRND